MGTVEKVIGTRRVFDGRIISVDVLDVETARGRRATREVVRHRGAAVVLPRLPDGRFVFVHQYRAAAGRVLCEAVAGTIDAGESPATCAAREVREETGFDAVSLTPLGTAYAAPGYSDEVFHFFGAQLAPHRGAQDPDEDEDLDVVCLAPEEVDRMVAAGEIQDSKTLAVLLLHARKAAP